MNTRAFFKEFISKPMLTGSIVPSSPALAKKLLENLKRDQVKLIVEVGPGTGAITHQLLDDPVLRSRYFGVDINPVFIEDLRQRYPGANFVVGSAEDLSELMKKAGLGSADFVVSGLPWSLIRPRRQERIFSNIFEVMSDIAEFATFTYVTTPLLERGRFFRKQITKQFPVVEARSVVWNNFPPAVVYRCRKVVKTE